MSSTWNNLTPEDTGALDNTDVGEKVLSRTRDGSGIGAFVGEDGNVGSGVSGEIEGSGGEDGINRSIGGGVEEDSYTIPYGVGIAIGIVYSISCIGSKSYGS